MLAGLDFTTLLLLIIATAMVSSVAEKREREVAFRERLKVEIRDAH